MKLLHLAIAVGVGVVLVCGLDQQNDSYTNSTASHTRRKRYLIFREISRGFARVNVRDRMIDSTSIWAQGAGYRWNVEYSNPPGLKIQKRDLHKSLGEMLLTHDFDGRACILRTMCEISNTVTPSSGFILKLFKRIFSLPQGDESYFPYLASNDCRELDLHCPISQLDFAEGDDSNTNNSNSNSNNV